jgi:hypothetical protein
MLRSPTKVKSVTQDIALIRHFKEHLYALSDQRVLDLLSLASVKPVSNAEVRPIFKVGRAGAWFWLSRLVTLGMLEKRGQAYKATRYTENLIEAVSITFQNVLSGKVPTVQGPGWAEALRLANDGIKMSYERGRIDQAEYARQGKMLKELEAQLDVR